MNPGLQLRRIREALGLTLRDVEAASLAIATQRGREDFTITISRLSDIETKSVDPSIYRLYSLSVIYRREFRELLSFYGVDLAAPTPSLSDNLPVRTHISANALETPAVRMPVKLDPGFDVHKTTDIGRMVQQWGLVPIQYLQCAEHDGYTYGYIGLEDFTMYPILLPGSFVQIDERRSKVATSGWTTEYERPIYFIETREGFVCSWCSLSGDQIIIQPHPVSTLPARVLRYPQEAEVIGQVVGVAMQLGEWNSIRSLPPHRAQQRPS